MLSSSEKAGMRATQSTALPDVATVTRRVYSSDGHGGQIATDTVRTLPCRITFASALDIQRAGAVSEKQVSRITFEYGADIIQTDAITVGTRSFEVLTILRGGEWETALVTLCAER